MNNKGPPKNGLLMREKILYILFNVNRVSELYNVYLLP